MRSSDIGRDADLRRRRAPRRGMGPVFWWFVVVMNAVMGGALFVVAVGMLLEPAVDRTWSVASCVALAVGGVAWVMIGSVSFHRNYLHVPPPDGRLVTVADVGGERAVVQPWRTTFLWQPFVVSVFFVVLLFGVAVVLFGEDNPGWWIPAAVVAPVALILPDHALKLRRRLRLVMSPSGIGVTGPDGDAWLDWDDVQGISIEYLDWWTVIRVVGVAGAPSWRYRRRPRVLYASTPAGPWVDVPGPALSVDGRSFFEAVAYYRRNPAARHELGGTAGQQRLTTRWGQPDNG